MLYPISGAHQQRTDRSSFSERSDENIEDMMFIDTTAGGGLVPANNKLSKMPVIEHSAPESRSFKVYRVSQKKQSF